MSLIVLYLCTRYDVYGFITLWDITICLFYVTFDLHLSPSLSVKVTFTLLILCILCCWMFVPKLKSVGSVEFEIWTFLYRKPKWRHYDVIINLISMKFTYKSVKSILISRIPNFSLIRHRSTEIYIREVNRELWRKNGNWVTVTLTFNPRSPISIGFKDMR